MEAGHFQVRKQLNEVAMRELRQLSDSREGYNERTYKLNDFEMVSQ
jgi:hypothetical protein